MNNALVQNTKYRRDIIRALALFTFTGGLLFSTLNFTRGLYFLSALELAYSLFSIFLWFIIPKTQHLSRWILGYIIPFFMVMMFALSLPSTSDAIFVWILTIPLLAYLLLGRTLGLWVSLIFIFLGIIAYHLRFLDSSNPFSLNAVISINITLSALLVMTIAHVYELNRDRNENRLIELAGTDSLTGLANRMTLEGSFQHISSLVKRHKIDFTLILIDIDFFKTINDRYGHDVGDEALCYIANFLNKNIRESDVLARFGGEEFALFITSIEPNQTSQHIENIREELSRSPFLSDDITINITLSAGLATYGKDGTSLESLLKKADERLYQAKHNGRNCIVFD